MEDPRDKCDQDAMQKCASLSHLAMVATELRDAYMNFEMALAEGHFEEAERQHRVLPALERIFEGANKGMSVRDGCNCPGCNPDFPNRE